MDFLSALRRFIVVLGVSWTKRTHRLVVLAIEDLREREIDGILQCFGRTLVLLGRVFIARSWEWVDFFAEPL